jgi:hypothetical protein
MRIANDIVLESLSGGTGHQRSVVKGTGIWPTKAAASSNRDTPSVHPRARVQESPVALAIQIVCSIGHSA